MNRRQVVVSALFCVCWIFQSGYQGKRVKANEPANVVLIAADDLGYGELGCYGQKIIRTPHLDRLAAEGIRFTDFYSGNAVCAPSRCCLMTGMHPGHAVVRNNHKFDLPQEVFGELGMQWPGQYPIPDEAVTIAELLQQAGYATAAFGKWGLGHFGTTGDPNRQGFDLFYGFNSQRHAHNHYPNYLWRNRVKEVQPGNDRTLFGETYSQDQFVDEACKFIRANQEKPFFAYVPFAVPHLSIQVPNESIKQYDGIIEEADYQHHGYLEHPRPRAGYAAMVTHMDAGVGKIIDLLKQLDLDQKTLVIFTSDNGPTYDRLGGSDSEYFDSAAGLKGLKGQLDEGGIRVPLIMWQPGTVVAGKTTDWMGAWWDLFPTVADAAGVKFDQEEIDGISVLPLARGEAQKQSRHEFLYWEFGGYTGQQAVRLGKWKAIRKGLAARKFDNLESEPPAWQLYDLSIDRAEQNDVAAQHPKVIDQVNQIAQREHSPSEVFRLPALDR